MTERPPFVYTARCSKCGLVARHGVAYGVAGYYIAINARGENVTVPDGDGEWLTRTCLRCGYEWTEACVDAQ